ncbi:hypothetical protein ON064_00510 [Planococcus sp. A6]|uniref:hypothetical protein n=1 Tax=Planococcus sp. A6 TaxID=2992760 RepID=UPI00237A25AB|nr:hypothetical protein [Planococcus sp. A6]MDE0581530.1 hypothetical protein [Planococcus sp. A6]
MQAKVIKSFKIVGKKRIVEVDEILSISGDNQYDCDAVYVDGEWLCDTDSPFASEYLEIIK